MDRPEELELSQSLEDYLETIYELVRDNKVARVKEIARLRAVRPGSVSPAMRRLADLGLIRYEQREYIDLTPAGEEQARRVMARHELLLRLLQEVLLMPRGQAETDACALEHALSPLAVERLASLFEFLSQGQGGARGLLDGLHAYLADSQATAVRGHAVKQVGELSEGEAAVVVKVLDGPQRRRLVDMGLLPGARLRVERIANPEGFVRVSKDGFTLALTVSEAATVLVELSS